MSDIDETGPDAPTPPGADKAESWAPATDAAGPEAAPPAEKPRKTASKASAKAAGKTADATAAEDPAGAKPRKTGARKAATATEGEPAAGEAEPTPEGERIAKTIARAGIASRRDAEAMILEGRVRLNGQVLDSPAINVTDADRIEVDGAPLPERERTRLWLFHKPRGVVTTARDPEGRQTVFEVLPDELPRVVAVGRLDINTEGLLLLTNDGGLAKVIAHPDTGWLRRYRVRAWGDTTQAELDRLRKGVTVDGMEYGPVEASLDRVQGDNLWITLGLREGKNREVKRILEHLGLSVNRLIRLSFGPFQLGDLEVGLVEEVRTKVLKEQLGNTLSEQAGVDFASPVREAIAPFGSPKAKAPAEAPARTRGAPKAARVPTGGDGPGPRRSVWRAEAPASEDEARRSARPPRRGADPRAERETAAARGRERVGAIRTGERRVVVERLRASPPEETAPAAPVRTGFRGRSGDTAERRSGGDREGAERRPSRGAPSAGGRGEREGGARPSRAGTGGDRERSRDRAEGPRERPQGRFQDRGREGGGSAGTGRGDRPGFAGRSRGADGDAAPQREGRPPAGGKGGAFKSRAPARQGRDERGGQERGGDRPRGGRPSGFKPSGDRPGGRPGGRPSGGGGGRPPRRGP
ncbi:MULTISPECIES: pseudouridine synthase [Methylobacterium]|uniref:Pseudouridine synthase n=2 Tax=Methylobacterium TaxID=407 RepID=A0ABQ4SWJ6_9HYPH|nr:MULTISPECIES: pseudouridine synthase [Methylobacterium]PIU06068.1 MAG: RNA-binding protein [Methylobacterium sp. CG09_land_8_20_14_0_10_71_15]GJE07571.1 hypothetical protein AOPFMNJM_2900 [Methylobacterium jeotgali]